MKALSEILGTKSAYTRLLTTREWAEFSRAVRSSKGNVCECCRLGNRITQIHHFVYDPSRKPWEYAHDEIALLCEFCHKELHAELSVFRKHVFRNLKPQSFKIFNRALAVALQQYDPLVLAHAFAEFVSNPHLIERYAKSWNQL